MDEMPTPHSCPRVQLNRASSSPCGEMYVMISPFRTVSCFCLTSLFLCVLLNSVALHSADNRTSQSDEVTHYQARVPLGWESFKVRSSGICFYLLGTVESPKLDGWQKVTVNDRSHLLDASGQPVRVYPEELQFRITASAREKLLENQPFTIASNIPINDYLLHLRFRLKVFHGLEARTVRPVSVEDIGMPADVSYDERIYRIRFNLGRIPIEDRIVLEVFAPTGERLSKFHVDLF